MSSQGAERATVHIVSDAGGSPPAVDPGREPESMPPVQAPPQELETDLGGQAFQSPTTDNVVAAEGGSVAQRMRARFEGMAATREFSVPGWELDDGRPGLIIEAKAFGDRKAFNTGVSNEAFIARSTHRMWFVNNDGSREEIAGGWGPALAGIVGVNVVKAADLVALVISKPDPQNPQARIPNVAGIGALATEIVAWAHNGTRQAEGDLGEVVEAASELQVAVNAVRMHMDWRPIMGLTQDDEGILVERVLARVVLGAAVEAHNSDIERQNRAARSNK